MMMILFFPVDWPMGSACMQALKTHSKVSDDMSIVEQLMKQQTPDHPGDSRRAPFVPQIASQRFTCSNCREHSDFLKK